MWETIGMISRSTGAIVIFFTEEDSESVLWALGELQEAQDLLRELLAARGEGE